MSLFVSKYREAVFEENGVKKYIWSTANDIRVRDRHRSLNNKVFSYDDPPVVDKKSGRRANPGEDYNCRCVAIPYLSGANG
jgi:SPP1 gp7 family putative phage head morphogenesis protein